MTKQPRINRNIRLNDEEWQIFREYMGAEWLRGEIKKVEVRIEKLNRQKRSLELCEAMGRAVSTPIN